MNKRRFDSKLRVLSVHVFVLLSLVASGCKVTTTPTTEPPVTGVPVTEVPTELPTEAPVTEVPVTEVPVTEPPGEEVVLMFVYPGTPDSPEGIFISDAVGQFQEQHPNISVDLQFDESPDYLDTLLARAAAGAPPDVARLQYFDLLQLQESLQALDELGFSGEGFLTDALDSALVNGQHYGLPQRRDSCALVYSYLSVFEGTQHPEAALRLGEYLTETAQQKQAHERLQWYPTREALFQELGLECETNEAIRPPLEVLEQVYEQVPERAVALDDLLEGGTVLPREGTGVVEGEALVGFGAPVMPAPVPGEPTPSDATPTPSYPAPSLLSSEEAQAQLEEGLVMGVLFINDVPEYPAGDYVIKCFPDHCVLVSPVLGEIPFDLLLSEDFEVPVEVPHMVIVPGSQIVCVWVLIWKRCTRVG